MQRQQEAFWTQGNKATFQDNKLPSRMLVLHFVTQFTSLQSTFRLILHKPILFHLDMSQLNAHFSALQDWEIPLDQGSTDSLLGKIMTIYLPLQKYDSTKNIFKVKTTLSSTYLV